MAKKGADRDTEVQLKALGHELRRRILALLTERKATAPASPRQVAREVGKPLPNVSYHVRVLAECEAIELVRTRPARGSMEHFYRASPKFVILPWVADILGLDPAAGGA